MLEETTGFIVGPTPTRYVEEPTGIFAAASYQGVKFRFGD
jgi:hypothetical protein